MVYSPGPGGWFKVKVQLPRSSEGASCSTLPQELLIFHQHLQQEYRCCFVQNNVRFNSSDIIHNAINSILKSLPVQEE